MCASTVEPVATAKETGKCRFLLKLFACCGIVLTLRTAANGQTITTQPQSQTVQAGSNVTFTLMATGAVPLSYQWRFGDLDLDGQTNSILMITDAQTGHQGAYSVVVSNMSGVVTSAVATLTVLAPPSIFGTIPDQSLLAGVDTTLVVPANGSAPLSYQWRKDGLALTGATHRILSLTNVQLADSGDYSAVVTNAYGSVTSGVSHVTVGFTLTVDVSGGGSVEWSPLQFIYPSNATVTLFAVSGNTSAFINWTGDAFGTNNPLVLTMTGPKTITANFASYTLSTGTSGGGAILLSPDQTGFPPYAVVTLMAVPDLDYGFVNWAGDASGPINPLKIIMDGNKSIIANFVSYRLVLNINGAGTVTVSPDQRNFRPSSTATLTAVPVPGSGFLNWSGNAAGTMNPLSILMNGDKVITANFVSTAINVFTVGSGAVTKSPDKPFYSVGEAVSLNAIPRLGFTFAYWGEGFTNNPRVVTIGANNNYTAIFSPTTAVETLTFSNVTRVAPVGTPAVFVDGSFVVTGAATRVGSAQLAIQTTFPNGSVYYSLDGSVPSFASSWYSGTFTLKRSALIRARAYDANFAQSWEADPVQVIIVPTYALAATTPGGGSITISPGGLLYQSNSIVRLTATPAAGWTFLQWLGDGNGAGATNTLVMDRDKCVQAVFGTTLNRAVSGDGSVLFDAVADHYPFGYVATLTAVPNGTNYFGVWGNAASGTNNPLRFTVTNANPTVSSLFAPLAAGQVALTVILDGSGRVTVDPRANRYSSNQGVTLTAIPEPNQTFLSWSGDASGAQNPLALTMNQSKVITAKFTQRPRLAVGECAGKPSSDGFQVTLTGQIGGHFQIDQTTDLATWTPLASLTNLYGTVQFTDLSVTNGSQRFYRAAPAP